MDVLFGLLLSVCWGHMVVQVDEISGSCTCNVPVLALSII